MERVRWREVDEERRYMERGRWRDRWREVYGVR